MKFNLKNKLAYSALALLLMSASSFAQNPFIRHMYTADPSAHVWQDGRLYVYASHDVAPPQGCDLMDRYHVFSTNDMVTWTDHGEILNSSQVEWGRPEGGFMWAPDCAYKDSVYYYYFPHPSDTEWNDSWKIGVATSRKPASDFTVQGYIPGLESHIDPCVFIDDDGQAYFYYGGGGSCKGSKLKDNMMEIDGDMQSMKGLIDFHEATWVHKYNGLYYLSYSDNHDKDGLHNRMRYATSDNPLGPWNYRGIYMGPTDSYTNHGSIVEYKGQWYAFYHNSALSGHDWLRSICVDSLFYNKDGTIQLVEQSRGHGTPYGDAPLMIPGTIEAEDFDKGGQTFAYSDSDSINNGGQYRLDEAVDIETCSAGGYNVGWTNGSEWLEYTVQIEESAAYNFEIIAASPDGNANIHFNLDGENVTGSITIPSTGDWQGWQSIYKTDVYLESGTHFLQLWEETGGFNIDKFIISRYVAGVEDNQQTEKKALSISPNPARTTVHIQVQTVQTTPLKMEIYDMLGRQVRTLNTMPSNGMHQAYVDVSNLASGNYFVKMIGDKIVHSERLLIVK